MAGSIGVAVVGAGDAGRAHALAYRSIFNTMLPSVRLVSIADIRQDLGAALATRLGYQRRDTSWHAIAEAPDIDVVSVVVANSIHREVVEGLLAAGKHVLCEKPLSNTVADARAMAVAARGASTIARVGFTYRRAPAFAFIRNLIQGGSLGRLLHFSGRFWCDYAGDSTLPISWRFKGAAGSGALADVGSHLADLAEFIAGPAQSIGGGRFSTVIHERPIASSATASSNMSDKVENDDYAAFTAAFEIGVGSFEVSRIATGHSNTLAFEIFLEHGSITYDHRRPGEIELAINEGPQELRGFRQIVLGPGHAYVSGRHTMNSVSAQYSSDDNFALQARAFLEEVAGIDERLSLPRCASFDEGVHNMEILDAVVQSALSGGAAVDLPARGSVVA